MLCLILVPNALGIFYKNKICFYALLFFHKQKEILINCEVKKNKFALYTEGN
jgi:hypothetical protein